MKKNQEFRVKFVKHRETSAGPLVEFSVGEKLKGQEEYTNYKLTVWGNHEIADGDTIKIAEIESFQVRPWVDKDGNKRMSYEATVKLSSEEKRDEAAQIPSNNASAGFVPPVAADPYNLPFDLG